MPKSSFQEIILKLQDFWASHGCLITQPYYTQVGAGTMNPSTFLRVLGPEPWNVAKGRSGRLGDGAQTSFGVSASEMALSSPSSSNGLGRQNLGTPAGTARSSPSHWAVMKTIGVIDPDALSRSSS